jgi:transposase
MANKVISMQVLRMLIQLLEKGFSIRRMSRELQLSRKTITQYVSRLKNSGLDFAALRQLDNASLSALVYLSCEPVVLPEDVRRRYFDLRIFYFVSELKRTGVTRLLLWEEYRKENPEGYGYTQFCVLLDRYRKTGEASIRLDHKPGEVVMIDFAGDKLSYVDKTSGELAECPVLVCVLPFSGYSYAIALPNASIPQVVKALGQCLRFFDGVPSSLKTDNMKQIVYKSCRYEPVFTEVMQQWALHYNIALLTARVAKPKDKASVENEVKLTYQRVYAPLRNRQFFSLAELNRAINEQLLLHHARPFKRKDYNRNDYFLQHEKQYLQPLPSSDFVIKHSVQAKVQKNYHITLGEDWHHYSIPYDYIGKTVTAVYDTDIVEVYFQHQRIALHKRSYKQHAYTTVKEHMPEGHQHFFEQRGWTADYFLSQAEKIGSCTQQYMQNILKGKQFTEQTYNACRGLLRLSKDYGPERMEAATKRALQGNHYSYRTIHNILSNNLDKQPTEPHQGDLFSMPKHNNLRGPEAYE